MVSTGAPELLVTTRGLEFPGWWNMLTILLYPQLQICGVLGHALLELACSFSSLF